MQEEPEGGKERINGLPLALPPTPIQPMQSRLKIVVPTLLSAHLLMMKLHKEQAKRIR